MAESSRRQDDDNNIEQYPPRPSTSASKRRSTHYDSQSYQRGSRPTSGDISRTRQDRESYHEPFDYDHLSSMTAGPPVSESQSGRGHLEDQNRDDTRRRSKSRQSYREPDDYDNLTSARAGPPAQSESAQPQLEDLREDRPGPVRNFSRRRSARFQSGNHDEDAPPPVPHGGKTPALPGKVQRHPQDPEQGEDTDENDSSDKPFGPRTVNELLQGTDPALLTVTEFWTQIYTISYLIFFSFWGTLARLGVQWLTFYPGTPIVTPVVWANFGGCVLMGFLSEDQALFRDEWWLVNTDTVRSHAEKRASRGSKQSGIAFNPDQIEEGERKDRKKAIPLYIGLTTGFCGCFTSFSSFARDVFLALSNSLPTPLNHPADYTAVSLTTSSTVSRNGGYSFLALIAVILYTLALALGGLLFGAHLALALQPYTPKLSIRIIRRILDRLIPFLAIGCWLGALFLCIWPPDRHHAVETWRGEVLFALVFAPLGCLLRFYASLHLNGIAPAFPLGTFAANMFGTALEGMCYDLAHVGLATSMLAGGGRVGCQLLQGIQDGFCGSLTTVSTLATELNALRRKHAYVYGAGSVGGALCLMVVIMGSVRWSVGWTETVCNTGYPSKVYG